MANSAHDEIKILEEDVAGLKREILSFDPENAQAIIEILDLLTSWQQARQAPSMEITRRSVSLTNYSEMQRQIGEENENSLILELHSLEVDEAGWTEHLPLLPREISSTPVSRADISLLASLQDREIAFSNRMLPQEENLTFADYINFLEAYQVGRPSTYASAFESLISEQLIEMEVGSIRLTEHGLDAIELLSRTSPKSCKVISQEYAKTTEEIANGSTTFEQGLTNMLASWMGEGEVNIDDVFSSLDEIGFEELFD